MKAMNDMLKTLVIFFRNQSVPKFSIIKKKNIDKSCFVNHCTWLKKNKSETFILILTQKKDFESQISAPNTIIFFGYFDLSKNLANYDSPLNKFHYPTDTDVQIMEMNFYIL